MVDLHCLYHSKYQNVLTDLDILQFSDLLHKNLKERSVRQSPRAKPGKELERIVNNEGQSRYTLTEKQNQRGHNVGKSLQHNCFACQRYLNKSGSTT